MAWLPNSEALAVREKLKPLMASFPFTSCVPFSNNTPLVASGEAGARLERTGILFRAAGHEAPTDDTLASLERLLGLAGDDVLHYIDRKKGQRRTARLHRVDDHAELVGFVLAGDTSAEAWIRTLLQDELPAQAYGRLLLSPGAQAPVAVQSRGKLVCTCLNVTDTAIDEHLAALSQGISLGQTGAGHLATDEDRLASLQTTLRCGTNCGSCIPELKRHIRSTHTEPTAGQNPLQRGVVPINVVA